MMNTRLEKSPENQSLGVVNSTAKKQHNDNSALQFVDNRPEAVAQRQLQERLNQSSQTLQTKALQEALNSGGQAAQMAPMHNVTDKGPSGQQQSVMQKESNRGLPDNLKTGLAKYSDMTLDETTDQHHGIEPATKGISQLKPSKIKEQVPAEFKDIPAAFIPENKAVWPLIKVELAKYENFGDEDFKQRAPSVVKLKTLLESITLNHIEAAKELEASEKDTLMLLRGLLKEEEKEVAAAQGLLEADEGALAADPGMSRTVKIEGTTGGAFTSNTDIVNTEEVKVDAGIKGKVGVIVDKWEDADTTVKKGAYKKVTPEDKARAGANFQDFKAGFVNKDHIVATNRVDKNESTKYKAKGNSAIEHPLFPHPPSLDDVKQGHLGDCYLLAAMASMVNSNPAHFVNHINDHGNGKVTVKLYESADTPVNVTINKSTVVTKSGFMGANV